MKTYLPGLLLSAVLIFGAASVGHAEDAPAGEAAANKQVVMKAMTEFFVKRDDSAVARYWGTEYIQHNPGIPNGSEGLPAMLASMPASFKYEPGMIVADGDKVMLHGRYTGYGPKPLIAVDIFRLEGGKIVEHWDVLQEEVPASQTKSGNPMFEPGK